jgi:TRAP-type C4-dicarboxylate transport system substrate-binding protein
MKTNNSIQFRPFGLFPALTAAGLLLGVATAPGARAQPVEIRYATILPRGVGQDYVLTKLEQDWRTATGGAIILHRSPGGQKEGEAGIVRKLRSGNYQAAMVSVIGLSEIEPAVAALQKMPLAFQTWEEVDYVREKIRGPLEDRLAAQGFVVLFWADSGWVNFFSVREAETPSEFRKLKLFAWSGDEPQIAVMKSLGYQPIPLETDYVLSSLASGMIDAAPLPPTFALGMQIPTVATHLLELNWVPIVGAGIIRRDAWDKIPADLKAKLRPLCESAGADLRAEGRRFHNDALRTLRKNAKMHVHALTPEQAAEWQALARQLGPKVRGTMVPADIYDQVQQLLQDYHSSQQISTP